MSDANKQTGPWTVESLPRGVQCGEGSVITGENAFRRYFSQRDTAIVIGDTPRDIACARADGVHVIAIATGPYRPSDLHGADVVIDMAREIPAALKRIPGLTAAV